MKAQLTDGDKAILQELVDSNASINDGICNRHLLIALESVTPEPKRAYILNWIPEQAEDIYLMMLPGHKLVQIEISRTDGAFTVEDVDEREYLKTASKLSKKRVSLASRLLEN